MVVVQIYYHLLIWNVGTPQKEIYEESLSDDGLTGSGTSLRQEIF